MRTRQNGFQVLKGARNFCSRRKYSHHSSRNSCIFSFLLETLQPQKILKLGQPLVFSSFNGRTCTTRTITTIDRNPEMIGLPKKNFLSLISVGKLHCWKETQWICLPHLKDSYDFVFMDSAKSKYVVFLPEVLKHLDSGGIIIIDDVFQGGDIAMT